MQRPALLSTVRCLALSLLVVPTATARWGNAQLPIFGGTPGTEADLAATVALVDPNTGAQFCTGTLIESTLVVTAAHCVVSVDEDSGQVSRTDASAIEVVYGVLDTSEASDGQRRSVTAAIPHPAYPRNAPTSDADGVGRDDDIAVLELASPIDDFQIAPILPTADLNAALTEGAELTITGYGTREPGGDESGLLYTGSTSFKRRSGYEFFAGGPGEPDTCPGDSGGPAYVEVDGDLYLVGATSRAGSEAEGDCGEGGIYTLVTAYSAWIDQAVSGAGTDGADGAAGADGASGADDAEGAGTFNCAGAGRGGSSAPTALALVAVLLGVLRRRPLV